jgi:predicted phage terminase large subunit-like protein
VPEEPDGSKEARAAAVTPIVEAGNAWLPAPELEADVEGNRPFAWVGDFIEEHAAFPTGAHDDQVDAETQALKRLILDPLFGLGELVGPEEYDVIDARGYYASPI